MKLRNLLVIWRLSEMKKIKVMLMMVMCLVFATTVAFAGTKDNSLNEIRSMRGQITEINGNMITVQNRDDANDTIALIVRWDTEILNGKNGDDVELSRLNVGDELTAYYSPISTRSLPPQSVAYALVMGSGEHDGIYMQVDSVEKTKYGTRILNSNKDTFVTIPEKVNDDAKELKAGDRILVWYDFVALSMPAQATATKAEIL